MGRKRAKPAPRKQQPRVGRRIRVREVRVIGADGAQLGVLPTAEALRLAEEKDLQLVEVNPMARPPVCKIMDFGKYKYETAKRERDSKRAKKSQELKEVKFRPKTHTHDFDFKVKHARRFLEEGCKVRLLVQFRGREVVHPETGRDVLERVCKAVEDIASAHQAPRMEGNRMNMILAPKARVVSASGASKPKPASGEKPAADASESKPDEAAKAPEADAGPAPEEDTAAAAPAPAEAQPARASEAEDNSQPVEA